MRGRSLTFDKTTPTVITGVICRATYLNIFDEINMDENFGKLWVTQ